MTHCWSEPLSVNTNNLSPQLLASAVPVLCSNIENEYHLKELRHNSQKSPCSRTRAPNSVPHDDEDSSEMWAGKDLWEIRGSTRPRLKPGGRQSSKHKAIRQGRGWVAQGERPGELEPPHLSNSVHTVDFLYEPIHSRRSNAHKSVTFSKFLQDPTTPPPPSKGATIWQLLCHNTVLGHAYWDFCGNMHLLWNNLVAEHLRGGDHESVMKLKGSSLDVTPTVRLC